MPPAPLGRGGELLTPCNSRIIRREDISEAPICQENRLLADDIRGRDKNASNALRFLDFSSKLDRLPPRLRPTALIVH